MSLQGALITMIEAQNSRLVRDQPSVLLKTGCEDVLYMFEVPMHKICVHGALVCGAIYYPALADTAEETYWIQDNQNLGHVVTWNPTIHATVTTGGNPLTLRRGDHLEFYIPDDRTSQQVYIYLENAGDQARLAISPLQNEPVKSRGAMNVFLSLRIGPVGGPLILQQMNSHMISV
jgi:hypothetical protein